METLTHGQLGLWIACLVTFLMAVLALVAAYRALTRNFVTKPELTAELLKLEGKIGTDLSETRHLLRNEMNAAFAKMDFKLETLASGQSTARETLARIETVLQLHIPTLTKKVGTQ